MFKVRAFRGAARAIEGLSESIADLTRDDKLKDVRGVGEGVARRIKELLDTGKIAEAEELRAKLPPGLVDLMNLPGIGLKTAQQVWKELAITSVDELEAAAKAGKLRDLPRFGQKREEKLIVAIDAWRKRAAAPKRRPMAEAMLAAEALVERVRAVPGVIACEFAGSLRRRAETIGDLDILVAAQAGGHAGDHGCVRERSRGRRGARQGRHEDERRPRGRHAGRSPRRPARTRGAPRSSTSPARRTTTSRCAPSR